MATYGFLPGVLVLARSIRRAWREQPVIYVALLDGFDLARPGFEDLDDVIFVDAATLDIANFPWLCLKYSAYELSCAVKPFIVRHALRQAVNSVWYVDADIAFFADPEPMRAMLASHSVVVTPHIVEALTDENRWRAPTIGHLAAAGLLNAGMFATRPSEDTARFLDAWSRMVTEPGAFLWELGHNQEQHSFNWVLSLVPEPGICRDKRINVAYWNLAERPVRWSALDGGRRDLWLIAREPLICFHYSGFRADSNSLSVHDTRHDLHLNASVEALCAWYRDALDAAAAVGYTEQSYRWRTLDGIELGEPIRTDLKRAERRSVPVLEEWPDDAADLARFLVGQAGFNTALPRLLDEVYWRRPELVAANGHTRVFPLQFHVWVLEHMPSEYPQYAFLERAGCLAMRKPAAERLAAAIAATDVGLDEAAVLGMMAADRKTLTALLASRGVAVALVDAVRRGDFLVPAYCPAVFLRFVHATDAALQKRFKLDSPRRFDAYREHLLSMLDTEFINAGRLRESINVLDLGRSLVRLLVGAMPNRVLVQEMRRRGIGRDIVNAFGPHAGDEDGFDATDLVLVDMWLEAVDAAPRLPVSKRRKAKPSGRSKGTETVAAMGTGSAPSHRKRFEIDGVVAPTGRRLARRLIANIVVDDENEKALAAFLGWRFGPAAGATRPTSAQRKALVEAVRAISAGEEAPVGGLGFIERAKAAADRLGSREPAFAGTLQPDPRAVNLFGYFRSGIGLGSLTRGLAGALTSAGFGVTENVLTNPTMDASARLDDVFSRFSFAAPVNLFVTYPHIRTDPADLFPPAFLRGRENVGYFAWEQRDLPHRWLDRLAAFDRLFALSSFAADALARASGREVALLPPVVEVDTERARRYRRADFDIPEDRFVACFIFDATSSVERKNPRGTVEAITAALRHEPSAYVVVKVTNGQRQRFRGTIDLVVRMLVDAGIEHRVLTEHMPREALEGLLACSDVYVSLHRSEGFGYTIAEAMSLGVPVVVSAYSGNMDFTTDANAYLVKCPEIVVERGEGPFQPGSVWGDPDIKDAAAAIRAVFEDQSTARRKAEIAHADIRRLASTDAVATRLARAFSLDASPAREPTTAGVGGRLVRPGLDGAGPGIGDFDRPIEEQLGA